MFSVVHRHDLAEFWRREHGVVDFSGTQLGTVLRVLPGLNGLTGPWVAGGSVRRAAMNEPLGKDVDVFFRDEAQFEVWAGMLRSNASAVEMFTEATDRRIAFLLDIGEPRIKVDLVCGTYFKSVEELLGDFDFTCCCFATDGTSLFTGEHTLFHAAKRVLKVNNVSKMHCSLDHMERYMLEGWAADKECLHELLKYGREERVKAKTTYSGPPAGSVA